MRRKEGIPPTLTIEHGFIVTLRRPQPDSPMQLYRDDGTCRAFHEWTLEQQIYPIGKMLAVGPGYFRAAFSIDDEELIRGWLTEHDLLHEDER